MNARLIKLWNDLQSSYYFIPGLMALGAVLLAVLTSTIDKNLDSDIAQKMGWFYSNKADGARAILTTIAGSMMTVAAVSFSITMVAVTTAAGQYGPRLIGNFMRDRANQVTLGTFTATFVYCLLILRVARTGDGADIENAVAEFVPNISLLVAMVLTLFSVGVMIFFVHHIPETLNVGNITGKVGKALRKDIQTLYPQNIGDADADASVDMDKFDPKTALDIGARAEGYVQAVDEGSVIEWAEDNGAVVRLLYRPGDFAVTDDTLMQVWFDKDGKTETDEETVRLLQGAYAMGTDRTSHQNILFLADELVEILARALSPGVNDPFTAINCINWFHSGMNTMMRAQVPSPYRRDESGQLRVIAYPVSFQRFVSTICDQSRPYIAMDRNAAVKMLTVLTELAAEAPSKEKRDVLTAQIDALDRAVQDKITSKFEREDLQTRFKQSRKMIEDEDFYAEVLSSEGWGGGRS